MRISKKLTLLLLSLCCVVSLTACAKNNAYIAPSSFEDEASSVVVAGNENFSKFGTVDGELRIRLTFSSGETITVLKDNPTTQSLLAQLPTTVTFDDFASAEKIAYFPDKLSAQDAPNGFDPKIGDVACYGPWGNLVFFYKDQPYANGLIPMGRVESGLEAISAMDAGFEVTIERTE